jgi:hypothetical protein
LRQSIFDIGVAAVGGGRFPVQPAAIDAQSPVIGT